MDAADKTSSAKKKSVLVIEDDQFLVRLYQVQLEKQGAEVWVANDGDQAMSYLSKRSPNAVILDLMLPGASGFDVLTAMRESNQWKSTPVFIVSNLGQESDIKRAGDLGVKDYTVKADMRLTDIIERVKKYLN